MSAKDELRTYVRGIRDAGAITPQAVTTIDRFADRIVRETVELTRTPHPFVNDSGGDAVCTDCWGDRDDKVHGE